MSKNDDVLAAANRILQALLLNSGVESFGIMHQVPFIQFRKEGQDSTLSFDSAVLFSTPFPDFLTKDEQLLLGMNTLNLKQVVEVFCNDKSDLEIRFVDGSWLKISGTSEDGYEPWQLSDELPAASGGTLLIADSEGAYAIWGNCE